MKINCLAVGRGFAAISFFRAPLFLLVAFAFPLTHLARAQTLQTKPVVIPSYHNDVSPALRDVEPWPVQRMQEHEAAENPLIITEHVDRPDPVVQKSALLSQLAPSIPTPILNFNGIPFPGVGCSCAPPDTNGEVGATQYVQMVNEGFQVFNKATGASVLGPNSISSIWSGFGGVCQTAGNGDPVVLYDQLANRWVITQFAGTSVPTDECVAVSTTSDATGTWNRYAFHLGSNFFDYPKLGVWPDAYYMSMNVFNSSGTLLIGPQAFAMDRAKMLAGQPATIVAMPNLGSSFPPILPGDLDGSTLPAAGAPASFFVWPNTGTYRIYHFHVDFAVPSNSTFTLFASPAAAGFTQLCASTRNCVPELGSGSTSKLDALGDRLMHRAAYRNFGDHESVVLNYTVSSGGVAGIRWVELRNVTAGPVTVFQQSTYQPDTTWRWGGSIAMDNAGNIALGYNASSSAINPQIRYTGRLATDPLNTLPQGEATIIAGTGSQTGTSNRWGDYSAMTVDPVDDSTFWYTTEYYATTGSFNWRTRIASFKLAAATVQITVGTNPVGRSFTVDGTNYTTTQILTWNVGSTHTISTTSPQSGTTGTQYAFNNWSDAGAISHSVTAPSTATNYTANFDTQYQLTTAANPSNGGSVSPTSGGYYNANTVVPISATPNAGFNFGNWTGNVANPNSANTTVTMSAPQSVTANFVPATVQITVGTSPAGLSFTVDSIVYTSSQAFTWDVGSSHNISTTSPQPGTPGTQYVFNNWSDGGGISHGVTAPSSATTYTASFDTQYQLTTAANPGEGGSVSPVSGGYYNANSVVPISATPNSGYTFSNWSGNVADPNSASTTVTMTSPQSVTANFAVITPVQITVETNPAGLSFTVDGNMYSSTQTFTWDIGSLHTISTTSPQAGTPGTQYVFNNWSDGGSISHSVTAPGIATTYTATFDTQYQLTTAANPSNGGTVSPTSGNYYNANSVVPISASPNPGFNFNNWSGNVADPNSASTTVTMTAPQSVIANFVEETVEVTVGTSPAGLSFTVDSVNYTSAQIFTWNIGSVHSLSTTSPQAGAPGSQFLFNNWSDSGGISHTVTASNSVTTYTASFDTQYQLTTAANPSNGGTVAPPSGNYYNANTVVPISATPNSGYTFGNWSGNVADPNSASTTVTMAGAQSVTANFNVINDFSISASPNSITLAQGGNGSSTISTAVTAGTADTISLVVTGAPSGASATLNPTSVTAGGSSTLNVSAGTAAPGSYTLTITGTEGTVMHSTTVTLNITAPAPDFSLSASPSSRSIRRGKSTTYTVTIAPANGFNSPVNLSISGLPAGAQARFTPNPATTSSNLQIKTAGSTTTGTFTLTITGISGALTHTTTTSLTIRL